MSAEIDQSTGKPAIAFTGEVPWHGLGDQLSQDAPLEEWREKSRLNWEARKAPVKYEAIYPGVEDIYSEWEKRFVLYRSDTGAPLGFVSNRYKPVQPMEVIEFFRDLVGATKNFRMDVAGALRGGTKVWALARAKGEIKLAKKDKVGRFLLLATSYDHSMPTVADQVSERVVCRNTLEIAVGTKGEKASIRIPHSTAFIEQMVKKELALDQQWQEFGDTITRFADTPLSDIDEAAFYLDVFYPESVRQSEDFSQKGADKRVGQLQEIARLGPGADLVSARGRVWGAVNAVTHYIDHVAATRGGQDVRLDKAWFGDGRVIKARAADLAKAFILN